jgi:uncharacterized protein (DUF2062 family)
MRRQVARFLRRLFALNDTPERVARAFALGVFLAFSPLLGLHAFLGLIIAFFFGLNRLALLLGVFINNPWTLVPIYTAGTFLGGLLIGFPPRPALPSFGWQALWSGDFWLQLAGQWHLLKPMFLGSSILSVFVAALAYVIVLHLLKHGSARRKQC